MTVMRPWDIETTTTTSFKRKANPFDEANWCVTHGYRDVNGAIVEHRFGSSRPPKGWFLQVLEGTKMLVGFNIKFDLLHALQDPDNLEGWMRYIADGGLVWDCQIAEYLLNGMGQKDQMLSLDEVAPRYGGGVKVDEVKALWAAGVQTQDIEPELLSRYLCGGPDENGTFQPGDVENTEKIAIAQIARARACGQLNSILLNMGALVFTVEAERNGMFVDKQQGMDQARLLDIEVDKLTAHLATYLPADLPFDFNWNSIYHKSALIFGGTVNYDRKEWDLSTGGTTWEEPDGSPMFVYAQKEATAWLLDNGGHTFVDPFEESSNVYATFKGGKNAGEFKTKKVKVNDYTKPKGRMATAQFKFAGYTTPEPEWKGAIPGVYSTSSEVIEELGTRDIAFLKDYASLMKLSKDLGTYYIKKHPETGVTTGMLTLVDALGIIHHKLNMCSTVTARLSSSDPNLQNIPKGNNSDIKLVFKSRFGKWITDDYGDMVYVPDGKIIQSDFSSLEVYVQAILTKCQQLIADLRAGLDMHCVKLAAKEGMSYDDVYALCKGDKYDKAWDYKRTKAKEYSFQSAFGAGDKAIAKKTGMAIEDVERLRAADEARYPEIPQYYADITATIKAGRKVTRTIPHPEFPGVMCNIGTSYFRTPDGKLYSYIESPAPGYLVKRGTTASFSPTEIRNYVVQGTGGEWAKAAMALSVRAFYARRNFGGKGLLVNQVHDAVYSDACNSVAFEAAALLHACMEGASDYMAFMFKWDIPLPVPSDTSWGLSMMDEDKIPGLKERAAVLRTELRKQYMGGFTPISYQ
jgi:hypothetical protein